MSEVTEVTVTTEETPAATETPAAPAATTEMIVGELKAKVEQLETECQQCKTECQNLQQEIEGLRDIHRWTSQEIEEIATNLFSRMNQVEETVNEIESENETENIEEESESNNEQIPVVPDPVEQEEPEQVTTNRRRPWFL